MGLDMETSRNTTSSSNIGSKMTTTDKFVASSTGSKLFGPEVVNNLERWVFKISKTVRNLRWQVAGD